MKKSIQNPTTVVHTVLMLLFVFMSYNAFTQNNSLVFQGDGSTKGYLVMNNGSQTTPIYLVINNSNTAAITRTGTEAGWIISENEFNLVRWNMATSTGTYTVPFGATTGSEADEYLPLAFAKSSSGSSDITFATYGTGADNTTYPTDVTGMTGIFGSSATDNLLDRYYFIDASAATTAEITFTYRGAENGTTSDPTGLVSPQQWDNTSGEWLTAIGSGSTGVSSGSGTVPSGSTSSFSSSKVWGLSHNGNPLPIQLIRFDAACSGNFVQILWETLTETNNESFTVQRSIDAVNFIDIATIAGAGNSNTTQYYSTTDNNPLNMLAYYRLKQTDFDGHTSYSEIKEVQNCNSATSSCDTYYDPQKGAIVINFPADDSRPFTATMYDLLGNQVIPESSKQLGRTDLDVGYLAYGIYLVVVRTNDDLITTKVYLNR